MQALFDSVVITWSLLGHYMVITWLAQNSQLMKVLGLSLLGHYLAGSKFEIYNFAKFWKFKYWGDMNWEMRTTTSEMRNLMNDCKVSRSVQQFKIPLLFCNNGTLKFVIFMISINLCSNYLWKLPNTEVLNSLHKLSTTSHYFVITWLCHYLVS